MTHSQVPQRRARQRRRGFKTKIQVHQAKHGQGGESVSLSWEEDQGLEEDLRESHFGPHQALKFPRHLQASPSDKTTLYKE